MSKPLQVWTRFTKQCNGKELKFRIQQLPIEKFDDVSTFAHKYFIPEEPFHKAAQLLKNEVAFKEYNNINGSLDEKAKYQIDACCIDDDTEELKIVAYSVMVFETKDDPKIDEKKFEEMVTTKEMKTFIKMVMVLEKEFEVKEKFNLDTYYAGRKVVVHPDYRGIGIAGEMLKTRLVICKARGVPMTGAWMTSFGSQRAAEKLGWETVCELQYKDIEKLAGVTFEGAPRSCKLMVIKA